MGIQTNPALQAAVASTQSSTSATSQNALQHTTDFHKQQKELLQKAQSTAHNTSSPNSQNLSAQAQGAALRHQSRYDNGERSTKTQGTVTKATVSSNPQIAPIRDITQQDLESSFVGLLKNNNDRLSGTGSLIDDSELTSNDYTINYLNSQYSARMFDECRQYGSMVLLEKNNKGNQDSLGIYGNHIYNQMTTNNYPTYYYDY